MEVITTATLSAIIGILATLITLYSNARNSVRKDVKENTEQNVSVRQEIKYISKGIEDIKFDTRSLTSSMTNINERLIRAEESIKSAHTKIDEIRQNIDI